MWINYLYWYFPILFVTTFKCSFKRLQDEICLSNVSTFYRANNMAEVGKGLSRLTQMSELLKGLDLQFLERQQQDWDTINSLCILKNFHPCLRMVQKSCDEIRNIALEFDNGIELTAYLKFVMNGEEKRDWTVCIYWIAPKGIINGLY